MNTILQKRIEEAAKRYNARAYSPFDDPYELSRQFVRDCHCFKEGANFSLQNQWIPVEEALPPIREKDRENRSWSDWVLIMTHEGGTFMDCYAFHRKEWLNNGNDVTHWMEIPKLNSNE